MDPAPVGPCEPKEVVQVVWDAEQFLLTVVRRCYGMEEEMRFGCCSDDVTVAVRAIAQDRTSNVSAVAVKVFSVISARIQAVVAANR